MAMTSKSKKVRLDFANLVNDAMSDEENTAQQPVESSRVERVGDVPKNDVIEEEHERTVDASPTNKAESETSIHIEVVSENSNNESQETQKQQDLNYEDPETRTYDKYIELLSEQSHIPVTLPVAAATTLGERLIAKRKGTGVQKSIYLEEDVYMYLRQKQELFGIKFSQVVNEVIREIIADEHK